MDEIDKGLSEEDMAFPQRPLHAFSMLALRVDPKGVFEMKERVIRDPDDFSNHLLCAHVHNWYEKRYGDRIKLHMGPGSYVLMIGGEHWKVEFPLCYGRNEFTIDENLQRNKRFVQSEDGTTIPSINILWHVEGMTQEIASSLSDIEKQGIFQEYMFGINAVQWLRDISEAPYMKEAKNDYDTAINCIFYKFPNYNNSKWASLQFAEKSMKSILKSNDIPFKQNHNLSALAESVNGLGFNITDQIVSNIQCSAGVRYGEVAVTKKDAILAVQNALALFSDIFKASSFG